MNTNVDRNPTTATLRSAWVLTLAMAALVAPTAFAQVRVEAVPELCSGLGQDQKPVVAVMDFKVKVDVTGDVGGGMASMLSNALLNSGCFNVVERARLNDVMNEQALGLSGAVEESTASGTGRIQGTRFQIMGELTEFSENESGIGGAARAVGRIFGGRRGSAAAAAVDIRNAHVGFIIRIVDARSAMVIASESFNKKRRTAGLAASSGWAGGALGGAGQISKAMADAVEEGIVAAVQYIEPYRSQMVEAIRAVRAAGDGLAVPRPGECELLNSLGSPLRVMVMIPEEHITGVWGAYLEGRAFEFDRYEGDRQAPKSRGPSAMQTAQSAMETAQRMIRPPDPAGETEITKRFLEHGFYLVDPKQYEDLRAQERYLMVNDDVDFASEVGRQYGADIVITGEAFSEFSRNINGLMSSRARVEAKAIEASTARIIAADGLHAGSVDVSEVIAGKAALRDAGGKVADYFLTQICAQDAASFRRDGSVGTLVAAVEGAVGGGTLELIVSGIDFMASSRMAKALEDLSTVELAEKKSFSDNTVNLHVTHSGSADELAEAILEDARSFPIEIVSFSNSRIVAKMN